MRARWALCAVCINDGWCIREDIGLNDRLVNVCHTCRRADPRADRYGFAEPSGQLADGLNGSGVRSSMIGSRFGGRS